MEMSLTWAFMVDMFIDMALVAVLGLGIFFFLIDFYCP